MTDLELALRDLGGHVDFPPTPDLVAGVRSRLAPRRRRSRRLRPHIRRSVALALAGALLAAASAVAAIPPLRHAVLEALGIRGVEVRRVPTVRSGTPPSTVQSLSLGARRRLGAAGRAAGFRVLVPSRLGEPDEVRLRRPPRAGLVSLVYRRPGSRAVRYLVSETRGSGTRRFLLKVVGPGTRVRQLGVGGAPGVWISGSPHEVIFQAPDGEIVADTLRLAGNTLLWERGGLVLRLEGARTLREALAIARSLRR